MECQKLSVFQKIIIHMIHKEFIRFLKFFQVEGSQRRPGVKKKFQKTLILVFEVIVQPPKHTFEIGCFGVLAHCGVPT